MNTLTAYPCNYIFCPNSPLIQADELPCWIDYDMKWDKFDKCLTITRLAVRYIVYGGAVYSGDEFGRIFGELPNEDELADILHEHQEIDQGPDYTPLASIMVGNVRPAFDYTVGQALLEQADYWKAKIAKEGDWADRQFTATMKMVNQFGKEAV